MMPFYHQYHYDGLYSHSDTLHNGKGYPAELLPALFFDWFNFTANAIC